MKKILAVAIATAFAAPAFAATSNVDISGYMNFSVDYLDADNVANDNNLNISSNSSNIIFKGAEDLGGGLKALWQVQTYFSAGATGNTDTSFGSNADGVGSGNTFVGLEGGFGKVLLGKMESPYKLVGRKYDLFGNQVGDSRNLINTGADIRPNNTVAYGTPNFGGFDAMVSYTTNLGAGASTENVSDTALALSAGYNNGPLSLGLGYTKVEDGAAIAGPDWSEWRFGASYVFGNFKVAGLYQKASDIGNLANDDADIWGLGAAYKMGNMTLKTQYYSREGDLVANDEADMWAVGLDYALSKRTSVYGVYATVDNEAGSDATPFGGGHADNPATVLGGNPGGFSLGMIHTF